MSLDGETDRPLETADPVKARLKPMPVSHLREHNVSRTANKKRAVTARITARPTHGECEQTQRNPPVSRLMLPLTFDHLFLPLYLKKGTTARRFHFLRVCSRIQRNGLAPKKPGSTVPLWSTQIVPKHQRVVNERVIVMIQVPVHRIPSE